MNKPIADVAAAMMLKNRGDRRRIEHSLKVYAYARLLGQAEFLGDELLEIVEITALLHDIGIHVAEKKLGKCSSQDQEIEGPPVASEILTALNFSSAVIERVCFIISRHHTFTAIDNVDFQILVEADFLVNASEDQMSDVQIINFAKNIFKTKSGINILRLLFPHLEFLI